MPGARRKHLGAFPDEDQLAQVLSNLPQGPSLWVVDDLWTPALLLKDILELPSGTEARDAFFRWRYAQHLALEEPQSVQALEIEDRPPGSWWACPRPCGNPGSSWPCAWAGPIHALIPRWLWIYNRLAPTLQAPGMLLSLCPRTRTATSPAPWRSGGAP